MFEWVKKRRNRKIKKEKVIIKNEDKNLVVIDPGASFYKVYGYGGTRAYFQSSCKLIDKRSAAEDANVITFNGVTYRIGSTFNSTHTLKHLKEYIPLVLMGISRIDEQVEFIPNSKGIKEIKLVMLTPSNQMEFIEEYTKKLNREFEVSKSTLFGDYQAKYKIELIRLCAEGLSSYLSLGQEVIKKMNHCLCINIGNSTSDVFLMDCKTNSPIAYKVVPRGSRQLMEDMMDIFIKKGEYVDDELMAQDLFITNNPIIKRCKKEIDSSMYEFWNGIMYSIRKIVAKTPYDATVLICGGTANIMVDAISKWFKNSTYEFEIKFLEEEDSRFADAIGAYRMVSGEFKKGIKGIEVKKVQLEESAIDKNEELEKVQSINYENDKEGVKGITKENDVILEMIKGVKGINYDEGIKEEKEQSIQKKYRGKETTRKVQELKAQGYKQEDVAHKIDMSLSTVKKHWNAQI